jgi:hypothetical protein
MRKILIIGLCVSLIGCAHLPETSVKPFVEPEYGMTKQQLIDSLGQPEAIEIYKKSDETRVEYYIYVRKYQSSQLKVPICLINERVVGWGKTFYEDHVSQDDIRIR